MSEEQLPLDLPQEPTNQSSPQVVEFNLKDLASVHNIIEVACSRAAFKPNELATVGTVYNKLTAFLSQYKDQSNG